MLISFIRRYVGILSAYAISLVIWTWWWTDCPDCPKVISSMILDRCESFYFLYPTQDIRLKQSRILHSILLTMESVLFGMFVIAIACDQFEVSTPYLKSAALQRTLLELTVPLTLFRLNIISGNILRRDAGGTGEEAGISIYHIIFNWMIFYYFLSFLGPLPTEEAPSGAFGRGLRKRWSSLVFCLFWFL